MLYFNIHPYMRFKSAYVSLGFTEVQISEISFSPHFPGIFKGYITLDTQG